MEPIRNTFVKITEKTTFPLSSHIKVLALAAIPVISYCYFFLRPNLKAVHLNEDRLKIELKELEYLAQIHKTTSDLKKIELEIPKTGETSTERSDLVLSRLKSNQERIDFAIALSKDQEISPSKKDELFLSLIACSTDKSRVIEEVSKAQHLQNLDNLLDFYQKLGKVIDKDQIWELIDWKLMANAGEIVSKMAEETKEQIDCKIKAFMKLVSHLPRQKVRNLNQKTQENEYLSWFKSAFRLLPKCNSTKDRIVFFRELVKISEDKSISKKIFDEISPEDNKMGESVFAAQQNIGWPNFLLAKDFDSLDLGNARDMSVAISFDLLKKGSFTDAEIIQVAYEGVDCAFIEHLDKLDLKGKALQSLNRIDPDESINDSEESVLKKFLAYDKYSDIRRKLNQLYKSLFEEALRFAAKLPDEDSKLPAVISLILKEAKKDDYKDINLAQSRINEFLACFPSQDVYLKNENLFAFAKEAQEQQRFKKVSVISLAISSQLQNDLIAVLEKNEVMDQRHLDLLMRVVDWSEKSLKKPIESTQIAKIEAIIAKFVETPSRSKCELYCWLAEKTKNPEEIKRLLKAATQEANRCPNIETLVKQRQRILECSYKTEMYDHVLQEYKSFFSRIIIKEKIIQDLGLEGMINLFLLPAQNLIALEKDLTALKNEKKNMIASLLHFADDQLKETELGAIKLTDILVKMSEVSIKIGDPEQAKQWLERSKLSLETYSNSIKGKLDSISIQGAFIRVGSVLAQLDAAKCLKYCESWKQNFSSINSIAAVFLAVIPTMIYCYSIYSIGRRYFCKISH